MKYYPAFVRLTERPCLVVGGGEVATQKVASLMRAEANVTVVSPEVSLPLAELAQGNRLSHWPRPYQPGDVIGFTLVVAATDDESIQRQVADEAMAAGILVNVVDRPELCSFIVPAILERGDLIIAASTSGQSPAMAGHIRRQLERQYGQEYADALQLLGRLRQHLATTSTSIEDRKRILTAIVDSPLLEYCRMGDDESLDRLLAETVGKGVSLRELGIGSGRVDECC